MIKWALQYITTILSNFAHPKDTAPSSEEFLSMFSYSFEHCACRGFTIHDSLIISYKMFWQISNVSEKKMTNSKSIWQRRTTKILFTFPLHLMAKKSHLFTTEKIACVQIILTS